MSLSRVFYEPFYSLSDFDRLFDEAFNARTPDNQGQNQVQQRSNSDRGLRPRQVKYLSPTSKQVAYCLIDVQNGRTRESRDQHRDCDV